MKARALALIAAAALGGCGKNTALTLTILVPPNSDPFADASTVEIALHGDNVTQAPATAMVSGGQFSASLEITSPPRDNYVWLTVDARNSAGVVVGHARTPLFTLPSSDAQVTVYVGRPGLVTPTAVKLLDDSDTGATNMGRKFLAGAALRGQIATPLNAPSIGALIVGGLNDSGQPMAKAWLYSPTRHSLMSVQNPLTARHGAVLVPSADAQAGEQALMWGGASGAGQLYTSAENFDPSQTSDPTQPAATPQWAEPSPEVRDAGPPGAYLPAMAEPTDGVFVLTGGSSLAGDGPALAQAVLVQRTGGSADTASKLGVTRLPPAIDGTGPLVVPRYQHSASRATLPSGAGALLFGGLSAADAMAGKPVTEAFLADKKTFEAIILQPTQPESRRGHAAISLPSGKMLIIGGYLTDAPGPTTVQGSALLIDLNARTYVVRDSFLRTPRYAASLTLINKDAMNKELLLCGGFDPTGAPIADCELFTSDDKLERIGNPIPLPHARAGHLALQLETHQVLLVGGVGDGLRTVPDLDIYTDL